jgi:hypothetical protein
LFILQAPALDRSFTANQALRLAIEDVVIEAVILTGWVEDVALHLSEPPKRNGDGDLGLG